MAQLATREVEQGRDGPDAEARGQRGLVIHVDLGDFDPVILTGNFVEQRRKHFAWPAPLGPKIHQHRRAGLQDFGLEIRLIDFNRRFHIPSTFPLYVTVMVTNSFKKIECQTAFSRQQSPEAFTVLMTSARLVLARSRSRAFSAEAKIVSSAARMQWPTGHAALGLPEGLAKGSAASTARYTSARLMRPGERFRREPDPAPLQVSTSLARCRDN